MTDTRSASKPCSYEYTVRRGDSFYLIAHRLGVPLRDLLEANSKINPARLMVGDVLCIPTAEKKAACDETQTAVEESPNTGSGSSTSVPAPAPAPSDSDASSTPEPPVPDPVPLPDADDDEPDDLLDHPAEADDADEGTPSPAPQPSTAPGDKILHTVAQGETLTDIQIASGLNLHTLQSANPETDLDALTAGQTLYIPKVNEPCPMIDTYTLRQEDTLESTALRLNVSIGALLRANPCLAPNDFVPGMVICIPE